MSDEFRHVPSDVFTEFKEADHGLGEGFRWAYALSEFRTAQLMCASQINCHTVHERAKSFLLMSFEHD